MIAGHHLGRAFRLGIWEANEAKKMRNGRLTDPKAWPLGTMECQIEERGTE